MNTPNRHVNLFSIARNGAVVPVTLAKALLRDQSHCSSWQVSSSADKETVISQLEQMLSGHDEEISFLRQRAVLMADEMLENALFAAPRDPQGKPLYAKGEQRSLLPGERITLRSYFDQETLALEISDSWGSLSPDTVCNFLDMNLADAAPADDRSGRGLFFMWQFFQDFYLSVVPGVETTLGGLLRLQPTTGSQGVH